MNDIVSALKALSLHGMASAWRKLLGTARIKTLDLEAVLHQLFKSEAAQRMARSWVYQMRVARFPSHRDLVGSKPPCISPELSKYRRLDEVSAFSEAAP